MDTVTMMMFAARQVERRLVEHLREAGAVDAASGSPIPDQGFMGDGVLRNLLRDGAIRQAGSGYYLDETAYAAFNLRRSRTMALLAVAAVFLMWIMKHQ